MNSPDSIGGRSGGSGLESPGPVALDTPFDRDGLYAMRAAVGAHATHLGATPGQVDALLIVCSELASNAVRHGGGSGRLRLWREGALIHCQVSDHGSGIADPMPPLGCHHSPGYGPPQMFPAFREQRDGPGFLIFVALGFPGSDREPVARPVRIRQP